MSCHGQSLENLKGLNFKLVRCSKVHLSPFETCQPYVPQFKICCLAIKLPMNALTPGERTGSSFSKFSTSNLLKYDLPPGGYLRKGKVAFLKFQLSCWRHKKLDRISFDGL